MSAGTVIQITRVKNLYKSREYEVETELGIYRIASQMLCAALKNLCLWAGRRANSINHEYGREER
jgi:hypothetical protein